MPHPTENIPPTLKQHPNWVAWGIRDAPTKAPFTPTSLLSGKPSPAKAGIRETWNSYNAAVECVRRELAQGIGYEFDGTPLYGVDLDHVLDETGTLTPEAREIVDTLASYTEVSPSGTGLHIFVLAPGADIARHRKKDHFLEIYNEGRYFTVTGNVCGEIKPIATRTAELQSIHDRFLQPEHRTVSAVPSIPFAEQPRFLNTGLERDRVFRALWNGERRHGNESADDIALMNKLAYWCNADPETMIRAFLSSPYHAQKDEAHKRKCQRDDYLPNTAKNSCATTFSTAIADYERWQQSRKRERRMVR